MSAAEIQQPLLGSNAASTAKGTRREPRQDVVRHVEYCSFPRARSDQRLWVGFTRDLSPSGMCVRVDTPERVGSLLRVTLREVDGQPRLESIARIAWSSPTIDGATGLASPCWNPGSVSPLWCATGPERSAAWRSRSRSAISGLARGSDLVRKAG